MTEMFYTVRCERCNNKVLNYCSTLTSAISAKHSHNKAHIKQIKITEQMLY
jgi:hypothetical protein